MKEGEYYLKRGTTKEDYFLFLVKTIEEEKKREGYPERTYCIIAELEKKMLFLAEMGDKKNGIKSIIHSEEYDEMGYMHIILMADDLRTKDYWIFYDGKLEEGKFDPCFTIEDYSISLRKRLLELSKTKK